LPPAEITTSSSLQQQQKDKVKETEIFVRPYWVEMSRKPVNILSFGRE
jgi:hypothetical protein